MNKIRSFMKKVVAKVTAAVRSLISRFKGSIPNVETVDGASEYLAQVLAEVGLTVEFDGASEASAEGT